MNHFPGDPFALDRLILSRPACAFGLQQLGTDKLWSETRQAFIGIREIERHDLFDDFGDAARAGKACLDQFAHIPLAIVPIGHDPVFARFILIQGVIAP